MTDFQAIYDEAHKAAIEAVAKVAHEEHTALGLACGFAWVDVVYSRQKSLTKDFRNWAKKNGLGSASHRPACWVFWNPGQHHGQSVWVIEQGAKAFAEVLVKHNIIAYPCSRLD